MLFVIFYLYMSNGDEYNISIKPMNINSIEKYFLAC